MEFWFAKIERDVIARGVFTSVKELARKLMHDIRRHAPSPQPVKWKHSDPNRRITTSSPVTVHSSHNAVPDLGLIRFRGHLTKGGYVDMMIAMENGAKNRRVRRSFKAGAVRLVLDEGKTVMRVARDLDLTASALRTWVERARADRTNGRTGLTTAEREELSRLRKECRELRMERNILKKAAAFFAKEST